MVLLLKVKQMFLNVFMVIRLKYFHDSLNIVVILAPGPELFLAKSAQFPLTFTEQITL